MNTATILHRTAMEFYDLAGIYKAKGEDGFFEDYRHRAWLLEKEAALQMLAESEDYTFKYLVIKSAGQLGFDLGFHEEAKQLLEFGLMNNPDASVKSQMETLLAKIVAQQKFVNQKTTNNFWTVSGTLTAADIENNQIKIRANDKQKWSEIHVSAEMIKKVIRFYLGELVNIQLDKDAAGSLWLKNISKVV